MIIHNSFFFIRHGETDANLSNALGYIEDIPLNQNGEDQASEAAYILKDCEISKIYSSNLARAKRTAEIISEICELEYSVSSNLAEVFDKNSSSQENEQDFANRIVAEINFILSSCSNPLIVSHYGVFKTLIKILNLPSLACKNAQIYVFSYSESFKSWHIEALN